MNSEKRILTVTQLNRFIRNWLEQDIGKVCVEGEISNLMHASSGHYYFTLKDSSAQLKCVFFKSRHTNLLVLQNGQRVVVQGSLSLYEARGDYQLIVETLEAAGIGELYRAFEALKIKLAALGLFEANRKKSIPMIPKQIGIITSPKGAALHDMMTTLNRRYPLAQTVLYPSDVQGNLAVNQLIQAIERANAENICDVIILARGGGSIEDLWSFNHELLAYAIARSEIPIVTGIGHETDFTIADFVADYRAATPTAAAEKVTPDWRKMIQQFHQLEIRLIFAMECIIQKHQRHIGFLLQKIASPQRIIRMHQQTLDYLLRHLLHAISQRINSKKHQLAIVAQALNTLSPLATLSRGYAIAFQKDHVLLHHQDIMPGDEIKLRLMEGTLLCHVIKDITHD